MQFLLVITYAVFPDAVRIGPNARDYSLIRIIVLRRYDASMGDGWKNLSKTQKGNGRKFHGFPPKKEASLFRQCDLDKTADSLRVGRFGVGLLFNEGIERGKLGRVKTYANHADPRPARALTF
jgi:hypothetical protein